MDNFDEYESNEEEEEEEEGPASLKGKGWDILVGGKDNLFAAGGDDPFDLNSDADSGADETSAAEDDEVDLILKGAAASESSPAADEETPPDAFWDRGRGSKDVEPSPLPGQPAEAPPRDLSPEDLGYQPASPPSATSTIPTPTDASTSPDTGVGISKGVMVTPIDIEGEALSGPLSAHPPEPEPISSEALVEAALVEPPKPPQPEPEPVPLPAMSSSGISDGVTVTPLDSEGRPVSITPAPLVTEQPETPSTEVLSPDDLLAELLTPPAPEPDDTPLGGPITPPSEETPSEDVGAGPPAPTVPEPVPAIPDTPPWPIPEPQSRAVKASIEDPFASPVALPGEKRLDLPVDQEMGKALITQERIDVLWDEIEETYNLVVDDVRGHFTTTEQAIDDLKEARELLLAGTEYFDNAEELVMQVKARLRLEEKVRQWSRTRGTWLAIYLVCWLILLSLTSLLTNRVEVIASPFVPDWMVATWLPGLYGGLGGVVGALWVLIKHIAKKRDFDPIHTPWYVTNPFMGIALGVVTYMIVRASGGILTNLAGVTGEVDFTIGSSPVLYALCVIVGFNQNVLWRLIDRLTNAIFPDKSDEVAATDREKESPEEPQG